MLKDGTRLGGGSCAPQAKVRAAVDANEVLQLLRPGLLQGRAVAVAAPSRPALTTALTDLGATAATLQADPADEQATDEAARALGPLHALVVDAAARFSQADAEGDELGPLRQSATASSRQARARSGRLRSSATQAAWSDASADACSAPVSSSTCAQARKRRASGG